MIWLSCQSHLVTCFVENEKRLAIVSWQCLASSLLKLWTEKSFSQVVNPLHNSINYDSVSELADQNDAYQTVGFK